MKKIFEGTATGLLAGQRSVMFCAAQEADNQGLSYKQHDFDTGSTALITKSVYLLTKYGAFFEFFTSKINDHTALKTVLLDNSDCFVLEKNGMARIIDQYCRPKWHGSLRYKGFAPSDAKAAGGGVWCAYPESGALIRYNSGSMRQEFRVSSGVSANLGEPTGLFPSGDELIFTCSGSAKIFSLNLNSFAVETIHSLSEPVYEYMKIDSNEVVLAKSGVYRL